MNKHKELAIRALKNLRGDDLARAERAFGHLRDEDLDSPYYLSGQTRRELLEGYRKANREIDEAIAWLESL